jgi:hypothetical protein
MPPRETSVRAAEKARHFITRLELPIVAAANQEVYRPEARVFADDTPGAAADAGSLVSFVSGLSSVHKSDVLNSTLLAQLAANKQFDRFTQMAEWYNFYIDVLEKVGWVIPGIAFDRYQPRSETLMLADAILEIQSAIASAGEMEVLRATLQSLEDDSGNEEAVVMFDRESFPQNLGCFQIFPCAEDGGDVVMALAAMQFTAEEHRDRFLWWEWSSTKVKLFRSARKYVLNEAVYSQVREAVIEKLGDMARQLIRDIEI